MTKISFLIIAPLLISTLLNCNRTKIIDIRPNVKYDSLVLLGNDFYPKKHIQIIEENDSIFVYVDFSRLPTIEKFYYCAETGEIKHISSISLLKHFEIKTNKNLVPFGEQDQTSIDSSVLLPPRRFCVHNNNIIFIQENKHGDFQISSLDIKSDTLNILYKNLFETNNIMPIYLYPPVFINDSSFVFHMVNYEQYNRHNNLTKTQFTCEFNIYTKTLEFLPLTYPKDYALNYHLPGSAENMPVIKGDSLVINFSMCNDIIVYNFKTKQTKHRFLKTPANPNLKKHSPNQPFEKIELINKHLFRYLYLYYDKKNNVFLRFYLLESEEDLRNAKSIDFFAKKLGVSIFSEDFSYIGDYVFGELKNHMEFFGGFFYCPALSTQNSMFFVPATANSLKVTSFNYVLP